MVPPTQRQQQQQVPATTPRSTTAVTPQLSESAAVAPAVIATATTTTTTSPVPTNGDGKSWRPRDEAANKVLVTRMADEETEDGRIRNREAMAKIRDAWVYKQVRERAAEFTEFHQVSTTTACKEWCTLMHIILCFSRDFLFGFVSLLFLV